MKSALPARFGAKARQYKYWFVQDGCLNAEAMRAAVASLVGDHDFRNFCKVATLHVPCCCSVDSTC